MLSAEGSRDAAYLRFDSSLPQRNANVHQKSAANQDFIRIDSKYLVQATESSREDLVSRREDYQDTRREEVQKSPIFRVREKEKTKFQNFGSFGAFDNVTSPESKEHTLRSNEPRTFRPSLQSSRKKYMEMSQNYAQDVKVLE